MTRPFKVGDIVSAESGFRKASSSAISLISDYDAFVGGKWFGLDELTLVTPVAEPAHKRGVETYKDQFTPWKDEYLVTRVRSEDGATSELEEQVGLTSNQAILKMME